MWSLATLEYLNRKAARQSQKDKKVPYVPPFPAFVNEFPPFPFPNLGCRTPRGWKRTGQCWFVDKTGTGYDWEPALTFEQFKRQLLAYAIDNPTHGYAIVEEGQFQLYVAAFAPRGGKS